MMNQPSDSIAGIALGIALVIFRRHIAEHIISFQNKTFGFEFGKRWIYFSELLCFLIGVYLVVGGFLKL